jgi:hypothetical protein
MAIIHHSVIVHITLPNPQLRQVMLKRAVRLN